MGNPCPNPEASDSWRMLSNNYAISDEWLENISRAELKAEKKVYFFKKRANEKKKSAKIKNKKGAQKKKCPKKKVKKKKNKGLPVFSKNPEIRCPSSDIASK